MHLGSSWSKDAQCSKLNLHLTVLLILTQIARILILMTVVLPAMMYRVPLAWTHAAIEDRNRGLVTVVDMAERRQLRRRVPAPRGMVEVDLVPDLGQ